MAGEFAPAVLSHPSLRSPFLSSQMRAQLLCHILAYAEMLLAWQLPEKRAELLKMVEDDLQSLDPEPVIVNETLYAAPMGM